VQKIADFNVQRPALDLSVRSRLLFGAQFYELIQYRLRSIWRYECFEAFD